MSDRRAFFASSRFFSPSRRWWGSKFPGLVHHSSAFTRLAETCCATARWRNTSTKTGHSTGYSQRYWNDDSYLPARIEESAARYAEAIRERQPHGPYLLGGWSFGGVLAFEIARQLHEQGQRVAMPALLDTWAPLEENKTSKLAYDDAKLLTQLARAYQIALPNGDAERRLTSDELIERALEQAKKNGSLPDDIRAEWIHRLLRLHKQSLTDVLNYIPQSYRGQITLFRTKRKPSYDATLDDWGWGRLSTKPVKVHVVPGDHYSMLADPNVQTLAQRLDACLKAVEE